MYCCGLGLGIFPYFVDQDGFVSLGLGWVNRLPFLTNLKGQ